MIDENRLIAKCNQEEKDLIDTAIEAVKRERETLKREVKALTQDLERACDKNEELAEKIKS